MAGDPERSATPQHCLWLLRSLGLRWNAETYSPCAVCRSSRTGMPRGQSDRSYHRPPEREERRKRGGSIDPHGHSAGKKIKGKKRHSLTDMQRLLMHAIMHSADIQDRDGGILLMATLFGLHPFLLKLYADGGYRGPVFQAGLRRVCQTIEVEIVKRSDAAKGFKLLPKRWIVERTIVWLNLCRRLAKDWECSTRKALAFLHLSSIRIMVQKLCQTSK